MEVGVREESYAGGSGTGVAVAALFGSLFVIAGIVVASLADPLDDAQLGGIALTVVGFAVLLWIPIVREVVTSALRSPTTERPITTPTITSAIRNRRSGP